MHYPKRLQTCQFKMKWVGLNFCLWMIACSSCSSAAFGQKYTEHQQGLTRRQPRQVVQPDWLRRPVLQPAQAADVRVTPQNIQETAAIRASIQKAVNEDTYVVPASPQQFQVALGQLGYGNWPLSMPAPVAVPAAVPWVWPGFGFKG